MMKLGKHFYFNDVEVKDGIFPDGIKKYMNCLKT